jgi:hypothetical protein
LEKGAVVMAQRMVRAAVKIYDKRQEREIVIPCHRHCDAFVILKEFGYTVKDYQVLDQGFLDAHDNFYNRIDARKNAIESGQIETSEYPELYSEDLW